jgi:hypothetical protein
VPVHLVHTAGGASVARIRAFLDLAVPHLRAVLAHASRSGLPAGLPPSHARR